MPTPEPISNLGPGKRRFVRILRLAALFSLAAAAFAVALVAKGGSSPRINILIAIALGAGLSVLLGTALLSFLFLSNSSRHDAAAADHQEKDAHEPRT